MSTQYAHIAQIIKRTLITIKIAPFVFTLGYIVCLLFYMWGSDKARLVVDILFYTNPMIIVLLLILSKIYQLCGWHRLQCCIPLFPMVVMIIDSFIVEVSAIVANIKIYLCLIMFIFSLINAYKIFLCNGK